MDEKYAGHKYNAEYNVMYDEVYAHAQDVLMHEYLHISVAFISEDVRSSFYIRRTTDLFIPGSCQQVVAFVFDRI